MSIESGGDPKSVSYIEEKKGVLKYYDSNGYIAGGLVQWNDKSGNFTAMLNNASKYYGQGTNLSKYGNIPYGTSYTKEKIQKMMLDAAGGEGNILAYQEKFLVDSLKSSNAYPASLITKLNKFPNTVEGAKSSASLFHNEYERSSHGTAPRENNAASIFKYWKQKGGQPQQITSTEGKDDINKDLGRRFAECIQKTVNSVDALSSLKLSSSGTEGNTCVIAQQNGNNDHMCHVLDAVLNGYYDSIEKLYVHYKDGDDVSTDSPIRLTVVLQLNAQSHSIKFVYRKRYKETSQR